MRMRRLLEWPDLDAPRDQWYEYVTVPGDADSIETRVALGWERMDEDLLVIAQHPDPSVGLTFVESSRVPDLEAEGYTVVPSDDVVWHGGALTLKADIPEDEAEAVPEVEGEPGDSYWLIHDLAVNEPVEDAAVEGDRPIEVDSDL